MIPAKKAIPVLVLSILLLTTSASVSASSPHGRWSGTVAAIAGDDLALVGVAERFHLAGSVTELVSGRTLSPRDVAPGSAVTLRIGAREADGRFRVDALTVQPKDLRPGGQFGFRQRTRYLRTGKVIGSFFR